MRHGGRGHEFETRHPLHFGCVHALRGHATGCWWSGMCAVLGQTTCSETPRPTGRSRLGTAEVEPSPRNSAGRAAALQAAGRAFNQSPGAPTSMSRSSRRPRTPPFQGGYAGSNPARDARTRNLRRAHASGVETGRNDWAAPEPVTGWITWGCSSTPGRAAALQAAGYRFEPCHLHHMARPR